MMSFLHLLGKLYFIFLYNLLMWRIKADFLLWKHVCILKPSLIMRVWFIHTCSWILTGLYFTFILYIWVLTLLNQTYLSGFSIKVITRLIKWFGLLSCCLYFPQQFTEKKDSLLFENLLQLIVKWSKVDVFCVEYVGLSFLNFGLIFLLCLESVLVIYIF